MLAAALVALGLTLLDRRMPVEIREIDIIPGTPAPGDMLTIRKHLTWHRRCYGEIYRQIVGSDREVRVYAKEWIGVPWELSEEIETHRIALSPGVPLGEASYRSVVLFRECGFTSRWWPLEAIGPEVKIYVLPGAR